MLLLALALEAPAELPEELPAVPVAPEELLAELPAALEAPAAGSYY